MISFVLPKVVGVESVAQLVALRNQIAASTGQVELDCSEVRFFDPFGMTMLACILETTAIGRVIKMPWLSSNTASYLERMDFFERIDVADVDIPTDRIRHDRRASLLEIKRIFGYEPSEPVAEQLATTIASTILGRPPEPASFDNPDTEHEQYYRPLRYSLSELIENALTHARRNGRGDAGVWIASQYFRNPAKVQIAVIDNGCGFLSTLHDHPELQDKTHRNAILTALKPKVSCNRDYGPFLESVNEGVGLTTTVRIAKATSGTVHIVSGDALVMESNSGSLKRRDRATVLPATWDGVAISLSFEPARLPEVKVSDHLPPIEGPIHKDPSSVALRFVD